MAGHALVWELPRRAHVDDTSATEAHCDNAVSTEVNQEAACGANTNTNATTTAAFDPARLEAVRKSRLLDTPPEAAFDRIVRLAVDLLHVPFAALTLVDDKRVFIKSQMGLDAVASTSEVPLSYSLCQYGYGSAEPLVINDAREHPVFRANGAVVELGYAAYVGVPVVAPDGFAIATLCVVDTKARTWSDNEVATLRDLAAVIATELELRAAVRALGARDDDWRRIFATLALGVTVMSFEGVVLWANEAAGRLFKCPPSSMTGWNLRDFRSTAGGLRDSETAARDALMRGEHVTIEDCVLTADGERVWIRANLASMRDAMDRPEYVVAVFEDISEQKRAHDESLANHRRYQALIQALPNCAVWLFDRERRHLLAEGDALYGAIGLRREDVVGRTIDEIASSTNVERLISLYDDALRGVVRNIEVRRNDHWFAVHSASLRDPDGTVSGGLILLYDVTRRMEVEAELRERTESLELLEMVADKANLAKSSREALQASLDIVCDHTNVALGHVFLTTPGGDGLVSSEIWHGNTAPGVSDFVARTREMRFGKGEGIGGAVLGAAEPIWKEDVGADPSFCRRAEAARAGLRSAAAFPVFVGEEVVAVIELYSTSVRRLDPKLLDMMASVGVQLGRVFERERFQAHIQRHAMTDDLTGLYNRRGFLTVAAERVRTARATNRPLVLYFIDLDGLKQINDSLGHSEGDRAIVATAALLRASYRSGDVVARLGGDEFVVLAEADPALSDLLVSRLEQDVARVNADPKARFKLSMSVGATPIFPRSASDIAEYLVVADAAMYELKRTRKASALAS